jgi:hypothetical protein
MSLFVVRWGLLFGSKTILAILIGPVGGAAIVGIIMILRGSIIDLWLFPGLYSCRF